MLQRAIYNQKHITDIVPGYLFVGCVLQSYTLIAGYHVIRACWSTNLKTDVPWTLLFLKVIGQKGRAV